MRRRRSCLMAVVGLWVAAPPLAGQAIQLRYRPAPGHVVHTISTYTASMTFTDMAGRGIPAEMAGVQDLTFGVEVLQSITDRVVAVDDAVTIERTVDSTRATVRIADMAQSGLVDPRHRATARMRLSDRLEVLDFEIMRADTLVDAVESALRAPTGFTFLLPEQAVQPGDSWTTELQFPLQSAGDAEAATPLDTTLVALATVTLDSLVIRSADTLAYLGIRGRVHPVTLTDASIEGVQGSGRLSGALAGTMIWSTGWNAFGSGAVRARLEMVLDVLAEGERTSLTLEFDVRNRFDIRL